MFTKSMIQGLLRVLLLAGLLQVTIGCESVNVCKPLFVYNFGGLEKLSPKEQIDLIKHCGYKGLILEMANQNQVELLPRYLSLIEADKDFSIKAAFVRYNFNETEEEKNRWRDVVDLIKDKDIALWVIFGPTQPGVDDQLLERVLIDMLQYSSHKGVKLAIYPHNNCYFNTCEEALPMVHRINNPNLSMVLHSCHELKAGNGRRLPDVIDKCIDNVSFVTIAGADSVVNFTNAWTRDTSSIKPIGKGAFDISNFVFNLRARGYTGDFGFINFKVDKKYELETYLQSSFREWQLINNNLSNKSW